jgi:disulfide bond formation protein DsbB
MLNKTAIQQNALYIIFTQALIAMFGSLFFSEAMNLPPCLLCWYQRIAMYPLVVIAAVGILRDDRRAYQYGLPLSIAGMALAIYHNLLYYAVIPEVAAPCRLGVSCTTKTIEWLGFVTIPLLSLAAFTLITFCFLAQRWAGEKK